MGVLGMLLKYIFKEIRKVKLGTHKVVTTECRIRELVKAKFGKRTRPAPYRNRSPF